MSKYLSFSEKQAIEDDTNFVGSAWSALTGTSSPTIRKAILNTLRERFAPTRRPKKKRGK